MHSTLNRRYTGTGIAPFASKLSTPAPCVFGLGALLFVLLLTGCEMRARVESKPTEAASELRLKVGPHPVTTVANMQVGQAGYTFFQVTTDGRLFLKNGIDVYSEKYWVYEHRVTRNADGYHIEISRADVDREYNHTWPSSSADIFPKVTVK